jgi:SAM-dependent methyltransferase
MSRLSPNHPHGPPAEEGLAGHSLLQSEEEWETRNRVLVETLGDLVVEHVPPHAQRGLDVGCQTGDITDALATRTDLAWYGVDPTLASPRVTSVGAELRQGWAHELPFPDRHFGCVLFANVYEHVEPLLRSASLAEIRRVLLNGGCVVGQLPNPYFPIESHSRLPLMGWLPVAWQKRYWRLAPVPWGHDFYVVTVRNLRREAEAVGFETVLVRKFNYPLEVIPRSVRWAAHLLERPTRVMPWAWQFVLRRPFDEPQEARGSGP